MKTWKLDGRLFRPDGSGMMTVTPNMDRLGQAGRDSRQARPHRGADASRRQALAPQTAADRSSKPGGTE